MNAPLDTTRCPACGRELLRTEQGYLCAPCALAAVMPTQSSAHERVGGYELLQTLDEGGTGIVYIARDIEHDSLVALKLAKSEILESAAAVASSFIKEQAIYVGDTRPVLPGDRM